MHPASTTAASGGIAGASVVILVWLLGLAHITVPADVAMAFGVVITGGIGYVMHTRMAAKDALAPPAPSAAAPTSSITGEAAKVGMLLLMIGVGLGGLLAACSSSQTQTAAKDAVTVAQAVQLACADLPPVEKAVNISLKGGALNTAKGIEVYVDAVCQNPNQSGLNNTTAIWVGQMVGMLKALLPAATTTAAAS